MLTRQEMFDRAVRGLRSQEWKRCSLADEGNEGNERCVYADDKGRHCAWGWVDTSLTESHYGVVSTMRDAGIGLAADLSYEDLGFALEMQRAHDAFEAKETMENLFKAIGTKYDLVWPEI